ncbi:hypothetical protein KKG56_06075 [bacterium]|nr:hypothetical protein [bacterium]
MFFYRNYSGKWKREKGKGKREKENGKGKMDKGKWERGKRGKMGKNSGSAASSLKFRIKHVSLLSLYSQGQAL